MKSIFSSPVVVCCPALPRDRADVLEFTKFTWDGRDYIQYVWDDWYADANGILAVAEYGGRCVGFAKVTLSALGQWWFQGFRVDPKYQDLKIGSHIHDYVDWWWLEHGDGVARFMTNSKKVKVHHLAEKLGYEKILEMKEVKAPLLDKTYSRFSPVKPDELPDALRAALTSPALAIGNELFDIGWETFKPTKDVLASIVEQDMAFWWQDREGLLLAWKHWSDEGDMLGISLPACKMESLPEMLFDVRRLAAQQGCVGVFWIAPLNAEIMSAVEAAGYIHHREHDNYLYEKHHPVRP